MIITINEEERLLDNSYFLEENINPISITPIVENSRLGCHIVSIDDIENIKDSYSLTTEEAVASVCDENGIDDLLVSVSEGYVMLFPEIVNECNIAIEPVSEDAYETIQLDECLDYWLETGDETPLDEYVSLNEILNYSRRNLTTDNLIKAHMAQNKKAKEDLKAYQRVTGKKLSPKEYRAMLRSMTGGPGHLINIEKGLRSGAVKNGNYLYEKDGKVYNSVSRKYVPPVPRNSGGSGSNSSGSSFFSSLGSKISNAASSGKKWASNNKSKIGIGAGVGMAAAGAGILASNGGIKGLTNKLSALKDRLRGAENQYEQAPPEQKGLFRRIIDKIKSMIATIIEKIKSLKNKKVDISMDGVKYVD